MVRPLWLLRFSNPLWTDTEIVTLPGISFRRTLGWGTREGSGGDGSKPGWEPVTAEAGEGWVALFSLRSWTTGTLLVKNINQ